MNLRCRYCSTLFALSMAEKSAALHRLQQENLQHYDAYCPRCRRANPIPRALLERFSPGWQNYVAGSAPKAAPRPAPTAPKPAMTASSLQKSPATAKSAAGPQQPARSKSAAGPAAKPKPAAKAKPKAAKPAARKSAAAKTKAKPAAKPKSSAKPAAKSSAKAKKAPARKK